MRIRKHAKISPLIYAASSLKPQNLLQPHVCQLNQSPWDVMSFSPPSSPPPPPPPPSFQLERNDNFERNGSLEDSITPFESVTSMKNTTDDELLTGEINSAVKPNYTDGGSASDQQPQNPELKEENEIIYCSKTDGKQWKCKREVARGNSFCDHHLSRVQNSGSWAPPAVKKQDKVAIARVAADSHRRSPAKKAALTSNPYEFYYYSGFGPRWGKKRGEKNISIGNKEMSENVMGEMEIEQSTLLRSEDSQSEIEYEEEEEEDDDFSEIGRKRGRKRIKARSLKSLM